MWSVRDLGWGGVVWAPTGMITVAALGRSSVQEVTGKGRIRSPDSKFRSCPADGGTG